MTTKKKELTNLTDQRQALVAGIRSFDPHKKNNMPDALPSEVKVKDGQQELHFRFQDGKLTAAPSGWGWALNWRYRDLLQYWNAHRQEVLLEA